jgi:integrase
MSTTFKIFLRTNQTNTDGTQTICIRLTSNRKQRLISLKIYVFPKDWSENKELVKRSDAMYLIKNKLIEKYRDKAQHIITDYILNDKDLTFAEFEKQFYNDNYGSNSFYDFVTQELENLHGKIAYETAKGYKSNMNKLKEFRNELSFSNIDFNFIRSYEKHLLSINNKNTTNKNLIFIKTFINKAIEQGVFKGQNPFINIPISREDGKREYLTENEVERLENLLNSPEIAKNKANVLRYFIFCCYTGLRFKDIQLLKFKHIKTESFTVNGEQKQVKIIDIEMHKTKKRVTVPIAEKAEKLIQYPEHFDKEKFVFDVMTSQPTNRYLKEIAETANIDKLLSFHVSRHTFATMNFDNDVELLTISKMLGHTNTKTTQIYAKVTNKKKVEAIAKFDK